MSRYRMIRHGERGEASLAEVAVAVLVTVIVAPTFAVATAIGWQYLLSVTAQATVSTQGAEVLAATEQELNGAQPIGYCPAAYGAGGIGANPEAVLETPLDQCSEPSMGPQPPAGSATWGVQLPSPSASSCGAPSLTGVALVTASTTCVGFFSYDYEPSVASSGGLAPALSPSGPLSPPSLVYLWVCTASCPNGAGGDTLWVTSYPAAGSYTNPGCPSSTAACSSPDWSTGAPQTRFIGTLAAASGVLSYEDGTGTCIAGCGAAPAEVSASGLGDVLIVDVAAQLSAPGQVQSSAVSVAVSGNVYQSHSNWAT